MAKKSFFSKLLTSVAKEIFKPEKPVKQAKPVVVKTNSIISSVKAKSATDYNKSARTSDQARWNSLDFVVGFEIRMSNNPCQNDRCGALAGKYPKWFKWVGWADNCRCHQISILITTDERDKMTDLILAGKSTKNFKSKNAVIDVPINFKTWVEANRDNIMSMPNKPVFIKDNFINGDIDKGLRYQ